mmetsp:Transcript_28008/g.46969  ORF Transcript_28008/g.46969 Transcript_28008/m.46969 type:complete len:212 (-) Transcript_28008:1617-2252(-)
MAGEKSGAVCRLAPLPDLLFLALIPLKLIICCSRMELMLLSSREHSISAQSALPLSSSAPPASSSELHGAVRRSICTSVQYVTASSGVWKTHLKESPSVATSYPPHPFKCARSTSWWSWISLAICSGCRSHKVVLPWMSVITKVIFSPDRGGPRARIRNRPKTLRLGNIRNSTNVAAMKTATVDPATAPMATDRLFLVDSENTSHRPVSPL